MMVSGAIPGCGHGSNQGPGIFLALGGFFGCGHDGFCIGCCGDGGDDAHAVVWFRTRILDHQGEQGTVVLFFHLVTDCYEKLEIFHVTGEVFFCSVRAITLRHLEVRWRVEHSIYFRWSFHHETPLILVRQTRSLVGGKDLFLLLAEVTGCSNTG